jgi:hypothetical protein
MYVSMMCPCGAIFETDTEYEESALLMALRFASAHEKHGYMTATQADDLNTFDVAHRQTDDKAAQ